jgi:hypothetical protein
MKCQTKKLCPKQPGNSPPLPEDSQFCTGCDKIGKDVGSRQVKRSVKKTSKKSRPKCPLCYDGGFMWYADAFDSNNGKPCPHCNPAGLCCSYPMDTTANLGVIRLLSQPLGSSVLTMNIHYCCGCGVSISTNGWHGLPDECPTMCSIHNRPVKMVTKKMILD